MNRCLTASDILWIWEWGRDRHRLDRALLILSAAYPELPDGALGAIAVGERDARLLRVRADTLGDRLDAFAACPSCTAALEFSFRASALVGEEPDPGEHVEHGPVEVEADGVRLLLHRPDSRDLAAIASAADVEAARRTLLRRCVLAASREGQEMPVEELPEALHDRISVRLAEADPQSDITLDIRCESCGYSWPVFFDITEFFWLEIDALVRRLADEVAALARAFGWREADILAMSPTRRRLYLETVT